MQSFNLKFTAVKCQRSGGQVIRNLQIFMNGFFKAFSALQSVHEEDSFGLVMRLLLCECLFIL